MIGYDAGAHFDPDDVSNGSSGYFDPHYLKSFENLFPATPLIDAIPDIGLLPSSGDAAEPDAALDGASELIAGMPGHVGTGGGSGADALPRSGEPSFKLGDGNPLCAVLAPMIESDRGWMQAGMDLGSGDADRLGNADKTGTGQDGFYVPDIADLAHGQLDDEYAFPQPPEAVEKAEEPALGPDATGSFGLPAELEASYEPFATILAGDGSNAFDESAPAGNVGNSGTEPGNAGRESEGLFPWALFDGMTRAFGESIPDGMSPDGMAEETDAGDIGAAIVGLDQLAGMGAAGTDKREAAPEGGTGHKLSLDLPEGEGNDFAGAFGSQMDLSAPWPIHKLPDDEGIPGLAEMWGMLRDAEGFLPKQSVAGRGSEKVTPGELDEGLGLPGLLGKLLARGDVNEMYPEALDRRGTALGPDGARSGPSGHKNDPIYTIAINQGHRNIDAHGSDGGNKHAQPSDPGTKEYSVTANSDILSAIAATGQLFAGYGTVTLGPVQFTGLSLPIAIPIGGGQLMSVQQLPGGARIIDVMAQDDADIGWAGYLDGQFATEIARVLDKIRRSGQAVTLAWDVFSYQVIVSKFVCQIRHAPMPYRISCTVIADNTLVAGTTAVNMALQVTADLSDGNPVAALGAVSQGIVGSSVADAGAAASATNATTVGSAAYTAAVSAVNAAATSLQTATLLTDATLAPLGASLSSLTLAATTGLDTFGFSTWLNNALAACGDAANLSAAQGYVIRAQQNLLRASA